jgi:Domain of unknown function (DUF4326)
MCKLVKRAMDSDGNAMFVGPGTFLFNNYTRTNVTSAWRFLMYANDLVTLWKDPRVRDMIRAMRGKDLVCPCKDEFCHGELLMEIANDSATDDPKSLDPIIDRVCTKLGINVRQG